MDTLDSSPDAEAAARGKLDLAVYTLHITDVMWLYDRVTGPPPDPPRRTCTPSRSRRPAGRSRPRGRRTRPDHPEPIQPRRT